MAKGYYVEFSHHYYKRKFGTLEGATNTAIEWSRDYPYYVLVFKRINRFTMRVIAKYCGGVRIE